MTATLVQVLNMARSQIGFREGPNNDNPYGPALGYANHGWYCAQAITWCFWRCGSLDSVGGKWQNCEAWLAWLRAHGMAGRTQRVGALAFFNWSGGRDAEHVELVEGVLPDGRIVTIGFNTGGEGNQSNGGGCYRMHRSTRAVVAYGYPAYAAPSPRPVPVVVPQPFGGMEMLYRTEDGKVWLACVVGGDTHLSWVSPAEWKLPDVGQPVVFGSTYEALRGHGFRFPGGQNS